MDNIPLAGLLDDEDSIAKIEGELKEDQQELQLIKKQYLKNSQSMKFYLPSKINEEAPDVIEFIEHN